MPLLASRLGRNVLALSAVSLLTDAASEMIYPLMPVFLSTVLGARALAVGAIEGAAESTAALLKLASGWWSDRLRRRKPLVVLGYTIATLVRPLVSIAQSVAQVLAIRLTDRVGKGMCSSPRDALIADSVAPEQRGLAFGLRWGSVRSPLPRFSVRSGRPAGPRSLSIWVRSRLWPPLWVWRFSYPGNSTQRLPPGSESRGIPFLG